MEKLSTQFFRKFPRIILGNELVASILDVVSRKLDIIKDEIDENLNTDL